MQLEGKLMTARYKGVVSDYLCLAHDKDENALYLSPMDPNEMYRHVNIPLDEMEIHLVWDNKRIACSRLMQLVDILNNTEIGKTKHFVTEAHKSVILMQTVLAGTYLPDVTRKAFVGLGPDLKPKILIGLLNQGDFQVVSDTEGNVSNIKKSEWVFGEPEDGVAFLQQLPNPPESLQSTLKSWTNNSHQWN